MYVWNLKDTEIFRCFLVFLENIGFIFIVFYLWILDYTEENISSIGVLENPWILQ